MANNIEQLLRDRKWEAVLEAYGTPGDFADKSYGVLVGNPQNKDEVKATIIVAHGYANRAALMAKQKEETEKRKNLPGRWTNDGNSCFLCDNVGQAECLGNNALLPFDSYTNLVLMPNRYASVRGHSLPTEKTHQQGNLSLSSRFFANAVELSEKYNITLVRNHPQAGMSIPGHDHFHSYPKAIKTKEEKEIVPFGIMSCELDRTEFGEEVYSVRGTRFDTIAFQGEKALESIIRTIGGFEGENKIFTLFYKPKGTADWNGTFFLTPHRKQVKGVGGQSWYIDVISPDKEATYAYEEWTKLPSEGIYSKEEFNWRDYF